MKTHWPESEKLNKERMMKDFNKYNTILTNIINLFDKCDKDKNFILYLGKKQKEALLNIKICSKEANFDNEQFYGRPIIWVLQDDHIHLAEIE